MGEWVCLTPADECLGGRACDCVNPTWFKVSWRRCFFHSLYEGKCTEFQKLSLVSGPFDLPVLGKWN